MPSSLTATQAREAVLNLEAAIEARIDLALTPEALTKLALKGVSESAARVHLRRCAIKALTA